MQVMVKRMAYSSTGKSKAKKATKKKKK
jgi:hypothetical protein